MATDVAFALAMGEDREVLVLNVVEAREGDVRLDLGGEEMSVRARQLRPLGKGGGLARHPPGL